MENTHTIVISVSTVIEFIGLFLLAREVYRGHKMEGIAEGFESAKRLQFLYATHDYAGFTIQSRLDQGDTPADAQKWVAVAGSAALQTAVEQQWGALSPQITVALKRWEEQTAPAAMRRRKRDLFVGTALLMCAAVIHMLL